MNEFLLKLNATVIREWISFLFLIIGGSIAIRTYVANQRQRKLENSFRLINFFKESLHEDDLKEWEKMFYAACSPGGVRYGHYFAEGSVEKPLSDLFDLMPPDNGAVSRMAEQFEILSQEVLNGTVNTRLLYFELGQLMNTTHDWLLTVENSHRQKSYIEDYYPNFHKMYERNNKEFKKWAYKKYATIC